MTKLSKLFVYGTLKLEPEDTHYIIANMWNVGQFPCVKLDKAERSIVRGQLLDVTDKDLQKLDRYEGVPHLYVRNRAMAYSLSNDTMGIGVYIYEWAGETDGLERINAWYN